MLSFSTDLHLSILCGTMIVAIISILFAITISIIISLYSFTHSDELEQERLRQQNEQMMAQQAAYNNQIMEDRNKQINQIHVCLLLIYSVLYLLMSLFYSTAARSCASN